MQAIPASVDFDDGAMVKLIVESKLQRNLPCQVMLVFNCVIMFAVKKFCVSDRHLASYVAYQPTYFVVGPLNSITICRKLEVVERRACTHTTHKHTHILRLQLCSISMLSERMKE